ALAGPGAVVTGGQHETGIGPVVVDDAALDLDPLSLLAPETLAGLEVAQEDLSLARGPAAEDEPAVGDDGVVQAAFDPHRLGPDRSPIGQAPRLVDRIDDLGVARRAAHRRGGLAADVDDARRP